MWMGHEVRKREKTGIETRQCHKCGRIGHLPHNCWKRNHETTPEGGPKKKVEKGPVKCYNCGKKGYLAMQCPEEVLFVMQGMEVPQLKMKRCKEERPQIYYWIQDVQNYGEANIGSGGKDLGW